MYPQPYSIYFRGTINPKWQCDFANLTSAAPSLHHAYAVFLKVGGPEGTLHATPNMGGYILGFI